MGERGGGERAVYSRGVYLLRDAPERQRRFRVYPMTPTRPTVQMESKIVVCCRHACVSTTDWPKTKMNDLDYSHEHKYVLPCKRSCLMRFFYGAGVFNPRRVLAGIDVWHYAFCTARAYLRSWFPRMGASPQHKLFAALPQPVVLQEPKHSFTDTLSSDPEPVLGAARLSLLQSEGVCASGKMAVPPQKTPIMYATPQSCYLCAYFLSHIFFQSAQYTSLNRAPASARIKTLFIDTLFRVYGPVMSKGGLSVVHTPKGVCPTDKNTRFRRRKHRLPCVKPTRIFSVVHLFPICSASPLE